MDKPENTNEDTNTESDNEREFFDRRTGDDRRTSVLELIDEIDRRIVEARRLVDKINKHLLEK